MRASGSIESSGERIAQARAQVAPPADAVALGEAGGGGGEESAPERDAGADGLEDEARARGPGPAGQAALDDQTVLGEAPGEAEQALVEDGVAQPSRDPSGDRRELAVDSGEE